VFGIWIATPSGPSEHDIFRTIRPLYPPPGEIAVHAL
jgi:hypothetical protein